MDGNQGTLYKILNGINNTLNIANKAIPIIEEAKPIFTTVNKTYKTIKNNGENLANIVKLIKVKNTIKKDMKNNIQTNIINPPIPYNNNYSNTNNPKFFI